MNKFIPPFIVIPMPLNSAGEGPETDPTKIVMTVYQVWDAANQTVSQYDNEHDAQVARATAEILVKESCDETGRNPPRPNPPSLTGLAQTRSWEEFNDAHKRRDDDPVPTD